MKKILIILIFLLTSCGYQALHKNTNSEKLVFQNINTTGNKVVNRKIISALGFSKNQSNYIYEELNLDSKKNILITSRNNKGQATSYKKTIETLIIFKNNIEIIKQKSFTVDFSYNTKDNKFDLAEYEKQIENNLVEEIIEKLIIYINL